MYKKRKNMKLMKLIGLALKENFPKAGVLATYIGKLWKRIFLLIC